MRVPSAMPYRSSVSGRERTRVRVFGFSVNFRRLIIVVQQRPRWWPRFSSTLRSTAVTARIGLVLGIAIAVLFLTGLLSHYQYEPWSWLPEPAKPVWGYRLTQGIHVATGIATIPLLLFKLWSVYPNQFRFSDPVDQARGRAAHCGDPGFRRTCSGDHRVP